MLQVRGNRLAHEKSPYLLQHKDNPVHWYPWGEEAFRAARDQGKVIFLSIGYSTCHWCHVMEHDSFERADVAEVLNRDFISIKVDREERPDVDQIYMDAVVGLTGQGGWPMSVFLTPDLKPFFGGTFFPRQQFFQLLAAIQQAWVTDREKILHASSEIVEKLSESHMPAEKTDLSAAVFVTALHQFEERFDAVHGGFGQAPKFPPSRGLSLLLRIHRHTGDQKVLEMVTVTLDHMARGGIYDHLGGGFSRYSTDRLWLVPHFEKMLYDNALLTIAYLEAFQVTGHKGYAAIAHETLDYILRDMTSPQGGFYSAEDADSESVEGKFYVWTMDELKRLLTPEEFSLFAKVYSVTDHGNFEHGMNILHLSPAYGWEIKGDPKLQVIQQKLFAIREKRVHPHKDDKILADWNGLMIQAMAKGYQVLGDVRYLDAARKSAEFLRRELFKEGKLLRRYRDGESRFSANQSDYAFVIAGLLDLYESDFDASWMDWARKLQSMQDRLFWDEKGGGYFFSEAQSVDLIVRKKVLDDGAIPSGNAVAALNLLRLAGFTSDDEYRKKAVRIIEVLGPLLQHHPWGLAQAAMALDFQLDRSQEIAIIGERDDMIVRSLIDDLHHTFLPNKVVAVGDASSPLPLLQGKKMIDGKTTIYVCEHGTCKLPTTDVEKAKELMGTFPLATQGH